MKELWKVDDWVELSADSMDALTAEQTAAAKVASTESEWVGEWAASRAARTDTWTAGAMVGPWVAKMAAR